MEYLKLVDQPLQLITENNICYFDAFSRPDLFFGIPTNFNNYISDFSRYSARIKEEIIRHDSASEQGILNQNSSTSGMRIRFNTSSKRIVFKVKLRRKYSYKNMTLWNSSGFDVYTFDDIGNYTHRTVFGPKDGEDCFAEELRNINNLNICIFLPNYNCIEKMYIGIEEKSAIEGIAYRNPLPILFYGNSITQGCCASRSGNSFVNVLSRYMDRDIINYSISAACYGLASIVDVIGRHNAYGIVIDYTRNEASVQKFEQLYLSFYKKIRKYYSNIKIILLTSSDFQNRALYKKFDDIVMDVYWQARLNGENTFLLNQRELFMPCEYEFITIDGVHYTDLGMYRIAKKLNEIFEE